MKKIFIVGCPRSGTTLLQSLLASHPEVVSFPETHLFAETIHINKWIRFLSIYHTSQVQKVISLLEELGVHNSFKLNTPVFSTKKWTRMLLTLLDKIGLHFSKGNESFLLEKTPRHLHYVDLIQDADPEAHFIHLIRKGEDVVASLMEATGDSPDQWKGARSPEKSAFWWNRSIKISRKYIGKPHHTHIRYEELVERPELILKYICGNISLDYDPQMLNDYSGTAKKIIKSGEGWKEKNIEPVISGSGKFNALPKTVRDKIQKRLLPFDYSSITLPEQRM